MTLTWNYFVATLKLKQIAETKASDMISDHDDSDKCSRKGREKTIYLQDSDSEDIPDFANDEVQNFIFIAYFDIEKSRKLGKHVSWNSRIFYRH